MVVEMVMLVGGRVPMVTLLVMVVVTVIAVAVVVVCDTGEDGPDGDLTGAGGTGDSGGACVCLPDCSSWRGEADAHVPCTVPPSLLSPLLALASSTFGFQLGH